MTRAIVGCLRLPGVLTGPIFGKELRVSSRRRRNYVLRFAYILCLTAFVALVWLSTVRFSGSAAQQKYQMAEAGKQIVTTVVIFQFIATQVLTIIMLSTAISDEIYHRTLGLLMTTSITSLQIVMGKLLSKLLQLILLMAITLPILAIILAFGGVPWMYLLSSSCITFCAAIFAGSLSLLFSIASPRAYGVIVRTAFVLGCLYFILPAVVDPTTWGPFGTTYVSHLSSTAYPWLTVILLHVNPVAALWQNTLHTMAPGQSLPFYWPVHCAIMLAASAALLGWSVKTVRKVALRQAGGQLDPGPKSPSPANPQSAIRNPQLALPGRIRRVAGPPVVWKEMRAPFVRGVNSRNSYVGLGAAILAQGITYVLLSPRNGLSDGMTHAAYGLLFVTLGLIFNIIFAATCITTEKESQSWLLLLATPLNDREILLGKAASAFRRSVPVWGLCAGHVLLFMLLGYIHPVAWIHLAIIIGWSSFFVISVGLYFSARCKHTGAAVVASLALLLGLWTVGPILAARVGAILNRPGVLAQSLWMHPLVQTDLVLSGDAGGQAAGKSLRGLEYGAERSFIIPYQRAIRFDEATYILVISALAYSLAGGLFLWRAKCHLRRKVF